MDMAREMWGCGMWILPNIIWSKTRKEIHSMSASSLLPYAIIPILMIIKEPTQRMVSFIAFFY
jgi:hypothetical protein